jgi:EpsD family peptidyl-prolyl cis-trans isomerase
MSRFSLFAVSVIALVACSKAPSPQSRVAARVNGELISIPVLQMAVSRASQGPQKLAPAAVMEGLIERKLFAQKAHALKYDQEPAVATLLDEAKEDVLARAYVANLAQWSREEDAAVQSFYEENRNLFEKRHIYRVIEITVATPPKRALELKGRVARAQDLYQVVAWLRAEGLPYNLGVAAKASEQLAPGLLSRLDSMREGEIVIAETSGGFSILQLLQSDPAPLTREAAAPMIEQVLRARKLAQVAEEERKYLRSKAVIEYVVDLGEPFAAQQARPAAAPTTPASSAALP